jgi:NADPH2:quinone reductase
MRAIAIDRFGTPDVCVLRDVPVPAPGPDDALIEIDHAGVNFIDIYMRNGTYARSSTYRTPLPFVLGMEGSGRVAEVGRNVRSLAVGDRVAYAPFRGSYAEFAVVPAWKVARVPDGIAQDIACAAMLQGTTAHYLTHATYPLKPGDWCLVHAAAGGAGQLIVQFAKRRGATVIGTVGSAEKAAIAKARGADHVILYKEEDVAAAVRELTGGRGVDVAYDSVARATFSASLKSVRRRGLLVLFGSASGVIDRVDPLELAEAGSVFFTRPHLADHLATPEEVALRTGAVFSAILDGSLRITIDRVFPLADAADAHRYVEAAKTKGKVLLYSCPRGTTVSK